MVNVILSKRVEDFEIFSSFQDSDGPSEDGMRRGSQYTVHVTYTFSFENEKEVEGGVSYDLSVIEKYDHYAYRKEDWTETTKSFFENYDYIVKVFKKRGVQILNFPAYMVVKANYLRSIGKEAVELYFDGRILPNHGDDEELFTEKELIARVGEEDDMCKAYAIARAIGDEAIYDSAPFYVLLSSIPDDLYGKTKVVELEKVTVDGLLAEGRITAADIKQALTDFLGRTEKWHRYYPLSIKGIERFILEFPESTKKKILGYCRQTADSLQFFRDHCPERINWRDVRIDDYLDSDLDLWIEKEVYAYEPQQWEFIRRCMEKDDLEKKVVEHAYTIGCRNLLKVANNLRTCTTTDLLRSVLRYGCQNRIGVEVVNCLCDLEYEEGLTRKDYDDCYAVLKGSEAATAFTLKVGLLVGVEEEELVKMLQESGAVLHGWALERIYKKFSFGPGLAWVKEEKDRLEAIRHKKEQERADSNERVVRFVQDSGKLAIRVWAKKWDVRIICCPDDHEIGTLLSDEKRVLLIEARNYYLINIEGVKKLHNGVFHFDVLEEDAGIIIGSKGSRIKEITKRLNELGCEVRSIKIHTHAAGEI